MQPDQRPSRLREPFQLAPVDLLAAHREPPAEGEQGIRRQQRRQPRLGPVPLGRPHHGPAGQLARQFLRPVHLHPRRGQRTTGRTEQLRDLFLGEFQRPGHRGGQQRGERRPDLRRTTQRQQRVHPRPRPHRLPGGRRPRPHLGRIRDQRRIGEAVQLENRDEGHARIRRPRPVVTIHLTRTGLRAPHLHPQRDPYARVMPRGDIRGPGALFGDVLRSPHRERRRAGDQRRAGGPRQPVRHRVEEGPHLPLGVGQRPRLGIRQRDGVRIRRHRRGEITQPLDVPRIERTQPPGVVPVGTHPRQQPPARGELQRQYGRGSPEGGSRMGAPCGPRPGEHRHRLGDRQEERRDLAQGYPAPSSGRTTSRGSAASSTGSPSGRQKATRPARGGSDGRKTAAQRDRDESRAGVTAGRDVTGCRTPQV